MSESISWDWSRLSASHIVLLLFVVFAATGTIAHGEMILNVDPKCDISNAGRSVIRTPYVPIAILFPVGVDLSSGTDCWIEFSMVTGTIQAGPGWPVVGPDGGSVGPGGTYGTNILSYNGVSGILANRFLFLAGVFLSDQPPVIGDAPARLDFRSSAIGVDFQELSPLIHQSFFIGDGRTSMGEVQRFHVPEGATRLFLGFLDSDRFGWPQGGLLPFAYWDNTGSLQVALDVKAVPEPSMFLNISTLGAMGVLFYFQRKRALRT